MPTEKFPDRESWHLSPKGYVEGVVWRGGKPRAMRQHRWVMEQHLERRLAADEDVHHINGVRTDNRIENLEVMDHSEHTRRHNIAAQRGKLHELVPTIRARYAAGETQSALAREYGVTQGAIWYSIYRKELSNA